MVDRPAVWYSSIMLLATSAAIGVFVVAAWHAGGKMAGRLHSNAGVRLLGAVLGAGVGYYCVVAVTMQLNGDEDGAQARQVLRHSLFAALILSILVRILKGIVTFFSGAPSRVELWRRLWESPKEQRDRGLAEASKKETLAE